MNPVILTAPSKLNLFLHIVGRRSDGYHLLESLVVFTDFGDRIAFEPSRLLSLEIMGPYAEPLESETHKNLIMRDATELRFRGGTTEGAKIILEKNIPIGAGLGGGSSDAGSVIEQLCRMWKLWGIDDIKHHIASVLGADVKMCLKPQTCFIQGIGEKISPVKMEFDLGVVLVNPQQPLPTADVYKRYDGPFSASSVCPSGFCSPQELFTFLASTKNDLEKAALERIPDIALIAHAIGSTFGCKHVRMTGSGATCFGLYDDPELSQQAAKEIAKAFPSWWVQAAQIKKDAADGKA